VRPPAPEPPLVRLDAVDSTQRIAFALAEEGAADGTCVVAEHQTGGRGRRGHTWEAPPGTSLLMSIVVRTHLPPSRRPLLSYAVAVGVADALERAAGVAIGLKWPNDLRVRGRKLGGILLEARGQIVVVGIGLNVNERHFPPPLDARATSLRLETGRVFERDRLCAAVREAVAAWRARLEAEGFAPVRAAWRARADMLGRTVSVDGLQGVAEDVDEDGALVLRAGTLRYAVRAGELLEQGEA
jgi:BirA family biotin operon repressor/biotin-[acetyl-CoA-carboxylase] ligase